MRNLLPPSPAAPTSATLSIAEPGTGSWEQHKRERTLLEHCQVLLKHRALIAFTTGIGVLLGITLCFILPPSFRAKAAVELLNMNEDFLFSKQSNPVTDVDRSNDTSELQTQVRVLQSTSLINQVIIQMGGRPLPNPTTPKDKLLNRTAASLKVRPVGRTRVIELSVNSSNAKTAAEFLRRLTAEYMSQSVETRWKAADVTSGFLRQELDRMRVKLQHSEDALQNYARQFGLLYTDGNNSTANDRLRQLQTQMTAATSERLTKQSIFQLAQGSEPETVPEVLNDPDLRASHARIVDLQRQLAQMNSVFTPEHSKVRQLQAELEILQSALNTDRKNLLTRIKNDYKEAESKESLLRTAFLEQTQAVAKEDQQSVQYRLLKREADSNRQLYDNMLQQMKQSSIAAAMRASNIRVIDPAAIPVRPDFPKKSIMGSLGLGFGFLIGVVFVLIRERVDGTLREAGQMQLCTARPELGTIPYTLLPGSSGSVRLDGKLPSKPKRLIEQVRPLITGVETPSPMAEAFRSVLTSLLFYLERSLRSRVLVVASASPGEGKTTVATNLGIAMAEIGKTVLLVDGDMRRPCLHLAFELSNERGLRDLLSRTSPDRKVLDAFVQPTTVPGLSVLPSGVPTTEAVKLLHSSSLSGWLTVLRSTYDVIIIDTPPTNYVPDARVLGRRADGVILVARAAQTKREDVAALARQFAEDNTLVLGSVLNGWTAPRGAHSYYHYASTSTGHMLPEAVS